MTRPPASIRSRLPLAAAFAALALAAGTGCDAQENADTERGRTLFVQKCGTCHALTQAATAAEVGPDLDQAFAQARSSGMDPDTIEGVVESQISNPRPASPEDPEIYMPANLVTGDDARDVAAYVASVAGVPGIKPPEQTPQEIFAQCGGCHTLAAAGTTGTTGPNLDETLPGQSAEQIIMSIVDPDVDVVPGFEPGVMPQNYEDSIPSQDLKALAQYLQQSVSGGGGGGAAGGGGGAGG
jgi:mono/diheme cytochrome c family protein